MSIQAHASRWQLVSPNQPGTTSSDRLYVSHVFHKAARSAGPSEATNTRGCYHHAARSARPLWVGNTECSPSGWWPSQGGTRGVGWRRSSLGAAGSSLVAALTLLDASSPGQFEKVRRR